VASAPVTALAALAAARATVRSSASVDAKRGSREDFSRDDFSRDDDDDDDGCLGRAPACGRPGASYSYSSSSPSTLSIALPTS